MRNKRKGFTLIELTVVIGIIVILTSAGLLSYKTLLDKTHKIACDTNLRAINLALNMYLHDYGRFPATGSDLVNALSEYNISPTQFHCPDDPIKNHNTYTSFYLQRSTRPDDFAFVLGCPYHSRGEKSLTLLYGYEPKELENLSVTLNGSSVERGKSLNLSVGDKVEYYLKNGTKFATVNVTQSIEDASVIAAFSLPNGKPYGIFKVNDVGEVDVDVSVPARFEVATPSTIAGVQGTHFTVKVNIEDDDYVTTIDVTNGTVIAYTFPETVEASLDSTEVAKIKFAIQAGQRGIVKRKAPYPVPSGLKIIPHYVGLRAGEKVEFEVIGYDSAGNRIEIDKSRVEWKVIPYLWECGKINDEGEYTAIREGIDKVRAKIGPRKAYAYIFVW